MGASIRITSEPVTGHPWCRRDPWGRRATVQLADGSLRWGYRCPETYEPEPGSACVVHDGPEVVADYVDGAGNVILDEHGRACMRRSDKGDGGWNIHSHVPDARWRIRTPEQAEADRIRAAELASQQRRRVG